MANQLSTTTGYEQLSVVFETPGPHLGLGYHLDFRPALIEPDRIVFESRPDARFLNLAGSVHGGYAAALLDTVMGCAVHARLGAGQGYATLDLRVSYYRPIMLEHAPIRAEGRVAHLGRRYAFAEGEVRDATGQVCAAATATLHIA